MTDTPKSRKRPKVEGVHIPPREAWREPDWDIADAAALQALVGGRASPEQQKRGIDFIIRVLAGTYDLAYRPESQRDTDFMLGRQFVGKMAVHLVNFPLGTLKRKDDNG